MKFFHPLVSRTMAAVGDVCAGLLRHKHILLRELCDTNILDVLVKKGIFNLNDFELISGADDSDKCNYFIEVVSKQSGVRLNDLCVVLSKECPKLNKELLNDRHRFIVNGYCDNTKDNMVMNHNIHRESPRSRRSVSQCSCNSISRRSSAAASPMPMPLPPLNNTMEMYVEPVVEDIMIIRNAVEQAYQPDNIVPIVTCLPQRSARTSFRSRPIEHGCHLRNLQSAGVHFVFLTTRFTWFRNNVLIFSVIMAMLAAPRRKQKVINLRAKNNAWSNDSTKFGQRMLEKMGWSEGKGLGANENGIVEHIVARYKNDDRGLGFEDRNDQWTKHEDDFNSLLANLSNGDKKEEKLHSGVSLEVKSKKSKARVHYHKFTRGKDLTRYSEKDLANIFGKKSLKNEEKKEEIIEKEEDIKTTEQVFTDKGSMVDYFKSKFASFKSKNKYSFNDNSNDDDRGDFAFRGFSGTGNDNKDGESNTDIAFQGFSFYNSEEKVDKENSVVESEVNVENTKKSKKKKKNKNRDSEPAIIENNTSENIANDEDISESLPENTEKVKKSKKNKYKDAPEIPVEVQDEEVETKKSKKKKRVIETVEEHNAEDYVPKKKKKRKNKESNDE